MKKIYILFVSVLFLYSADRLPAQLINYNGTSYFLNGVNIPWHNFNCDFGNNSVCGAGYDSAWFDSAFARFQQYGVNCARVWLFNDGGTNPVFGGKDSVTGLSPAFYANLDNLFKLAQKHNIMLIPSIWSFPMMDNDTVWGPNGGLHSGMIQDTNKIRLMINNAIIPMVERYASQCNLFAWEIINEPEWSMNVPEGGTTTTVVNANQMQCFVGMIAEAIHEHSPKMVTVGSATLRYNSDEFSATTPCLGNYWKNSAIQGAYNKPLAYLDFYEIHYYDWMTGVINFDPYQSGCQESYWELDKPTLIGESQGNSKNHTPTDMLYNAYVGNYAGVLFWSYNAGADSMGQFKEFNSALLAFRNAAPGIVNFDSAGCLTTGVSQLVSSTNVNIYPNPANDILHVDMGNSFSPGENIEICIRNILGQKVITRNLETERNIKIQVKALPAGMYIIQLREGSFACTSRFAKN
ncbi:MAG: T9SS type A sorting domain-containing protein [Bacteroidia bacterium]